MIERVKLEHYKSYWTAGETCPRCRKNKLPHNRSECPSCFSKIAQDESEAREEAYYASLREVPLESILAARELQLEQISAKLDRDWYLAGNEGARRQKEYRNFMGWLKRTDPKAYKKYKAEERENKKDYFALDMAGRERLYCERLDADSYINRVTENFGPNYRRRKL